MAISIAKLFFDRSSPMLRDSFRRSTSISPMLSEIHLAARGSEVFRKIFVAGCESIASASWPYRFSIWLRPCKLSTTGLPYLRFSVTAV